MQVAHVAAFYGTHQLTESRSRPLWKNKMRHLCLFKAARLTKPLPFHLFQLLSISAVQVHDCLKQTEAVGLNGSVCGVELKCVQTMWMSGRRHRTYLRSLGHRKRNDPPQHQSSFWSQLFVLYTVKGKTNCWPEAIHWASLDLWGFEQKEHVSLLLCRSFSSGPTCFLQFRRPEYLRPISKWKCWRVPHLTDD